MNNYREYIGEKFEKPYACLDLVVKVWNEKFQRGIPISGVSTTMEYFRQHLIPTKAPREGDLVLMKSEQWHAGVVISEGNMIHTFPDGCAGVERYDGLLWKNRVRGFYTWI